MTRFRDNNKPVIVLTCMGWLNVTRIWYSKRASLYKLADLGICTTLCEGYLSTNNAYLEQYMWTQNSITSWMDSLFCCRLRRISFSSSVAFAQDSYSTQGFGLRFSLKQERLKEMRLSLLTHYYFQLIEGIVNHLVNEPSFSVLFCMCVRVCACVRARVYIHAY